MHRVMRICLGAAVALAVLGVAQAQDAIIRYYDRAAKNVVSLDGKIEQESTAGLTVQAREGKTTVRKMIAAGDIVEVLYKVPEVSKLDFSGPFVNETRALAKGATPKERAKRLQDALAGFQKLAKETRGNPNVSRYLQFKVAMVTAEQAQDDPARVEPAIKLLADFQSNHPASWQSLPALKMLARLQESAGKTDDARKTYEDIADLPDAPVEVRHESAVLVSRLFLRGGKYADAEKRLSKLVAGLSPEDPQRPYVRAYLVESRLGQNNLATAEKDLREVLRSSADARLRGVASNLLGDYYRKKGQLEEAFWHYLRVDALYNEDALEQAKALYYLAGLFDQVKKDPVRGKECARRLQDKRFASSPYPKMVKVEE